jgi:Coenzyme PQQ synthesis protein D (PqqD)
MVQVATGVPVVDRGAPVSARGAVYTRAVSPGADAFPESVTVVASNDLLAREFGDEFVILNLRDGVYYGLETVGVRIWQLLQEPRTVHAIRDIVVAEFDVAPAQCDRDVRMLLGELAVRGLIETRPGA